MVCLIRTSRYRSKRQSWLVPLLPTGCASIDPGRGTGGGAAGRALFCGLIQADGKCCHWPKALFDPSPEGLGNVFNVGNKRHIAINGADIDADLVTEV